MGIISQTVIDGINVQLDLRTDGIYLMVNRPAGNSNKVDFASVRTLIDNCGIQSWDFSSVLDATESMMPEIDILISSDTSLKQVDEKAQITVSSDKMSAEIVFTAPINNGKRISSSDIRSALQEEKIFMGIDESVFGIISNERKYDLPYVIATGHLPRNGRDGSIEYFFNTGKISHKPKELEDGKIDYLNLDIFQVTSKGRVLAEITPPEDGIDGFNVAGEILKSINGKAILSPVAKNVSLTEDGLRVISDIDGQIIFQGNKISVTPVLEINGNVDNSTGNINFLGTVVVKKNVLTGFTISATGNIEINGVVEGAAISCESDILIRGGVQGMNKAQIVAKGSVTAKFIENATVNAGVDVVADSIVRSNVKCGGSLILSGKRGQLIGGSAKVLNSISVNILGSQVEASTEIQAGLDPDLFDMYMERRAELAKLKKEFTQLNQIINTLAKAREEGKLTLPKKAILVKSLQSKTHVKAKISELYSEIEQLIPRLTKGNGIVRVQKLVNPGVKITIGNAILYVKDKLEHCSFKNVDGEIRMGEY